MAIRKREHSWKTKDGREHTATKWEAEHVDPHGKRRRKSFDRKTDAQSWLDEQTTAKKTGMWVDPDAGRSTFGDFSERWLALQVSKSSTIKTYDSIYRNHLRPPLAGMRLDRIHTEHVQRLIKEWTDDAAPATVHARYNLLAIIFRAAVQGRRLAQSPCGKGVQLPELPPRHGLVPISRDTVIDLADSIDPRYRAFVLVAAGSGLRRGELCGLTFDRVGFDFNTIRVDRQLARASHAEGAVFTSPKRPASIRNVPVAPFVTATIRQHVERFGLHESGLILTTWSQRPATASAVQSAWAKAARAVGTDATPHDLRHYFASEQLRHGCSIKKLQAMLGHKSAVETLDTYGHLIGDEDDLSREIMQEALGAACHGNATVGVLS